MNRMNRILTVTIAGLGGLTCVTLAGPEWIESNIGNAGRTPDSAQPTGGIGSLGKIDGDLDESITNLRGETINDFEDIFIIRIDDPSEFSATTVPSEGSASFDTQIWLFTLDGRGLLGNDDTVPNEGMTPGCLADVNTDNNVSTCDLMSVINRWGPCGGCCLEDINGDQSVGVIDLLTVINNWGPAPGCVLTGSTLLPNADDGTNQSIPGPGYYLLAVSSSGTIPVSASGPIFDLGCRAGEISGPDGPGAATAIVDWIPTVCHPRGIGNYNVAVGGGVVMSGLSLDVRPGSCPNPFNPTSLGTFPVSILGSGGFDVAVADPQSITVSRTDGVGSSVALIPNSPSFEDKSMPFHAFGQCGCAWLGLDSVLDLNVRFSSPAMAQELELASVPGGSFVEIEIRGEFKSGAPFSAVDCIWIVPPHLYAFYYFPEDDLPIE